MKKNHIITILSIMCLFGCGRGGNNSLSTEPVETPQPTEPVETPQPTEPVETPQPTEPVETPQPTEPVETPQPTEPVYTLSDYYNKYYDIKWENAEYIDIIKEYYSIYQMIINEDEIIIIKEKSDISDPSEWDKYKYKFIDNKIVINKENFHMDILLEDNLLYITFTFDNVKFHATMKPLNYNS